VADSFIDIFRRQKVGDVDIFQMVSKEDGKVLGEVLHMRYRDRHTVSMELFIDGETLNRNYEKVGKNFYQGEAFADLCRQCEIPVPENRIISPLDTRHAIEAILSPYIGKEIDVVRIA
jgi:hypothetical protein